MARRRKSNPNKSTAPPKSDKSRRSKLALLELIASLSASLILLALAALHSRGRDDAEPSDADPGGGGDASVRKEAFLKWLDENGAVLRPLRGGGVADLEEFPEYGGWGLAVSTASEKGVSKEERGASRDSSEAERSCPSEDAEEEKEPVVRRLDALFTVPPNLILSVRDILRTHASSSSPRRIPAFRSRLRSALRADPRGGGLAAGSAEQDVVLALHLAAENCRHANRRLFEGGSFWGPYLDVLPDSVPRLDTFGDEEYGVLDDAELEKTGRDSLNSLREMYNGSGDDSIALKTILLEMIQTKLPPETSSEAFETTTQQCTTFESFHRFVAIVSSRAMVLRGEKRIVPLADMLNCAPLPAETGDGGSRIRPSFELFHSLEEDGGMTIRSDRDVYAGNDGKDDGVVIQLFEDYGPVDSSLFLEAHGFVPRENPYHCAVIEGSLVVEGIAPGGVEKEEERLARRALEALGLINPESEDASLLRSVCARRDLTTIEDGSIIGRRPASDSIAVASLLLGKGEDAALPRRSCIRAVESDDVERIELRCARYPGSSASVESALKNAAKMMIEKGAASLDSRHDGYKEETDEIMKKLSTKLREAEAEGREQLALACRFRIEERRLLAVIAYSTTEETIENRIVAETAVESDLQEKLHDFNIFIESLGLPTNKIEPRIVGNGMRIGTHARETIEVGDVYLSLPPNAVIDSSTTLKDAESSPDLKRLLERYYKRESDGFMMLLIYLIHERFIMREQSKWWPYLNLLPTVKELKSFHPLFFQEEEINRHLAGSDVRRVMIRYQQRTAEKHAALSLDLNANLLLGSERLRNKDIFYWASAIIDSRSIWWDGKRHLVPLLDLVNADSVGNPHETRLEEAATNAGESLAVTRASRHVQQGEQLFENYAQPNHSLLTYHGFILENNPNDCALMEGLFLRRDDPGAANAHLLRSVSSAFCIKGDLDSLQQLAYFLRVKHNLLNISSSEIGEDVRPYLIKVLGQRISRLKDFIELDLDPKEQNTQHHIYCMQQLVRNDLQHFEDALKLVSP